ncbi:hypothetical protein BC833DRAFT_619032 [Globomyces pollinis-pini]|nr:hypothetical protein BC833DRAFT_619032 [Globomyces pollinis-pini]
MILSQIKEYQRWKESKTKELWHFASKALRKCTVIDNEYEELWYEHFNTFPKLITVKLRKVNEKIIKLVPASLNRLEILVNYHIDENQALQISNLLEKTSCLKSVYFRFPKLTDNVAIIIQKSLENLHTLRHLDIGGWFLEQCNESITNLIQNNNLLTLRLLSRAKTLETVIPILINATTLRELDVYPLDDPSCSSLIKLLKQNKFLKSLSYNWSITSVLSDTTYNHILEALKYNTTLKDLSIPLALTKNLQLLPELVSDVYRVNPQLLIRDSNQFCETPNVQLIKSRSRESFFLLQGRLNLLLLVHILPYDIICMILRYYLATFQLDRKVLTEVLFSRKLIGVLPGLSDDVFDSSELVRCCCIYQSKQLDNKHH